jgi:tetratricopeptide (TPR) repeat protein
MVLPPPTAHDAPRPDEGSWLEELKLSLKLSKAGVLLLVDHARPDKLGSLVRELLPEHPDLEVYTDVSCVLRAPHGATLVLAPRAADADWLNLNRPVFSERALKVVLWCNAETTAVLARQAVDFFDWISDRVECPLLPPRYAVAGLRCALAARAPGVVWRGDWLEGSFVEAFPRRRMRRVSAAKPYAELLAEVRAHPRQWIGWTDVDNVFRLRRVRWALAEAGRRSRTLLINPAVESPGWWPVLTEAGDLHLACERLERAGARSPGRLAALVDLEPGALELVALLLEKGGGEREIEQVLRQVADPGAALGRLALDRGAIAPRELVRGTGNVAAMRAFRLQGRRLAALRAVELERVARRWESGDDVDFGEGAWWAAWTRTPPAVEHFKKLAPWGSSHAVELMLRHRPYTPELWTLLSKTARKLGELDVAESWVRRLVEAGGHEGLVELAALRRAQGRHEESAHKIRALLAEQRGDLPSMLRLTAMLELAMTLEVEERYAEAEALLRQVLELERQLLDPSPACRAEAMELLGSLMSWQGRYHEAEALLKQALVQRQEIDGPSHPFSAVVVDSLALAVGAQGRTREAESLLRRSLEIKARRLEPAHPSLAVTLNRLSNMLRILGRYPEAESLARQVCELEAELVGRKHRVYAEALFGLAGVLLDQGRHAEAQAILLDVLAIHERDPGAPNVSRWSALSMLAETLLNQGRYRQAEKLLLQALQGTELSFGAEHPSLAEILPTLGLAVAHQEGRMAEGRELVERGLELSRRVLGPAHLATATALRVLAVLHARAGSTEAPRTAQAALSALTGALGPEHAAVREVTPILQSIISGAYLKSK